MNEVIEYRFTILHGTIPYELLELDIPITVHFGKEELAARSFTGNRKVI